MPLFNETSAQQVITSATQPTNPSQGLIWNELDSNNNLVEAWRYINGFWWSEEKLFNVFTVAGSSGFNYYLAMNPAYNYFIKSAHLLFEVASAASYSSVFNFFFQIIKEQVPYQLLLPKVLILRLMVFLQIFFL
ncbi:hypothetical protein PI95_034205 [Hassallia byssoidea VB512170]|uniref:Uncharacterized protein n=1 Tax=Hassallia byssoidea VB512170 TaxID=1304833 RepID=A0A846HNH2_9CYAN|nr:hypothetical protein [Hassalia byssoidea]NEU77390.1 hypothetical protein [Hassalia byssoidea VB512170]